MTDQQQQIIQQTQANATTLIMGDGGSGKSSLLATVAEYVYKKHGKWSSYYLVDGGGVPTQVSALVNLGIIKLWRMRTRSGENLQLETMQRASLGWWPKKLNLRTGETESNIELVAPTTEVIRVLCGACQATVQSVLHQGAIKPQQMCPKCQKPVNSQTWVTRREFSITKGFENRGACLFDGITSAGDWGLDGISFLNLGGEGSNLGGRIRSGLMEFGSNNRSQIGFMQTRAMQWLQNGAAIPGLVVPAVWTSLIADGREDGLPIKGPKLPGQAKTTAAPQMVGNLLEAAAEIAVGGPNDGKPVRRLYIKAYVDKDGVKHLLKPRAYPGLLPPYLEDPDTDDPKQPRFVNYSLGTFFELMEQARVQSEVMIAQDHPNAPGIPEEIETFGGETETKAAPVTPAVPAPARPQAAPPAARRMATPPAVKVATPAAPAPAAPITPADVVAGAETATEAALHDALAGVQRAVTPATAPAPAAPKLAPPAARPPARGPIAAPPGRRPVAAVVKPGGTT